MDADRFDSLARFFTDATSRRNLASLLTGTALGGALASSMIDDVKSRKKKCKPCRKKKKGKCKGKKPDGTACGGTSVCQNGKCLPSLTESCSASNGFCAVGGQAHCQGVIECGCFVTVESEAICANLLTFDGCPATTGCTASNECDDEEFCVSMPCCPDGKAVCIPLCVPA